MTEGKEFAWNAEISKYLTLRRLCVNYRDGRGREWFGSKTPELDGSVEMGQMCRLRSFENHVGHPVRGRMMAYHPTTFDSVNAMVDALQVNLNESLRNRSLWCLSGVTEYLRQNGAWSVNNTSLLPEFSKALDDFENEFASPLSAYSCHAYYESQRKPNTSWYREMFVYGSQVTPMTGLLGTLHNNTSIDMTLESDGTGEAIHERRYKEHYEGILCAGHTAHSGDAGVARRVTCAVDVRLVCRATVTSLELLRSTREVSPESAGKWLVACMGFQCHCETSEVARMVRTIRRSPGVDRYLSVYTSKAKMICLISLSSGALVKPIGPTQLADSTSLHLRDDLVPTSIPKLPARTDDHMSIYFSPYFMLIPFVEHDRPPRPLIASVQTQQAVCLPWSPGTAAVSPCYSFRPLVRTPMMQSIIDSQVDNDTCIPSELPGFDVSICYANIAQNYEDCMVVSRRFVDLGGFSSYSVCSYLLPGDEYVSPVGTKLCSEICRWWKSYCPSYCKHQETSSRTYSTGTRHPVGTVLSSRLTPNGERSVSVLSYAPLQTGDKISMGHGQKGVAFIVPQVDMPYGVTAEGTTVNFDVVMSVSSVVNRQTNGIIYEAVLGVSAARDAQFKVTTLDVPDIREEVTLMDPRFGSPFPFVGDDGSVSSTQATWGFTRAFSQTQMVRERQHATHSIPGSRSIATPVGRSRGGAVRLGEMEIQAMASAGLTSCLEELSRRGSMVTCDFCVSCKHTCILCSCDSPSEVVSMRIPYGTLVLDCTMATTEGMCMEYDLRPLMW